MNEKIIERMIGLPGVVMATGITLSFVLYWCSVSGFAFLWPVKLIVLLAPAAWECSKMLFQYLTIDRRRRQHQKNILLRSRIRREFDEVA